MKSLAIVFPLILLFYVAYSYNYVKKVEIPELPEIWWGPGSEEKSDTSIRPFKISFSQEDITDLRSRLKRTRQFPAALEGTGWSYGVDGSYLPIILQHWYEKYDFAKREAYLNRYPQFLTNVQGLDIHYVHAKPQNVTSNKRLLPLLLQHGWPGSVVEFHKILPILTTPRDEYDFVFEVVAPSLPGFGFSSSAVRPGLGSPQMAVVLKNLMLRIGFDKFYTQGGDWGAIITAHLAALFPQHVLGVHSNMCVVLSSNVLLKTALYAIAPSLAVAKEDESLMYPLKGKLMRHVEETGYFHIQATKPDTVGIGLIDSPAGLAAYILEKFSTATNGTYRFRADGGLFEKFEADELIDNLMMYWIPRSMTTAMRIYAETFNMKTRSLGIDSVPINVPSACAQFPNEIIHQPMEFLKDRFKNLLRATRMPRGGHFAAMEEPELLANDIFESVDEMEKFRKNLENEKVCDEL
ncbi:juvenile hormone epoxide hydrolase 2-like [Venturia canescens]|uniref:juvenile hormone epoxide hydrolase 2-like n=1 Tax=Venturia canescens TaxID=32260 RepID=UPI001C9D23F2|nr:juvenile hormone epoxide hydrolase 2-like [Venturia canescens]